MSMSMDSISRLDARQVAQGGVNTGNARDEDMQRA